MTLKASRNTPTFRATASLSKKEHLHGCSLIALCNSDHKCYHLNIMTEQENPTTQSATKHAGGRPTLYTAELTDRICELLADGKSMRKVSKELNVSVQTMFSWLRLYPEFLEQYTRAKEEAADLLVEEMLDIADEISNDTVSTEKGDKPNSEWINRSRLRVDTRKWVAAKLKPKKYGDKLDMTTNGKDLPTPILGGLTMQNTNDDISERQSADV